MRGARMYRIHVRFREPKNDRPSNLGRTTEVRRFVRPGDAEVYARRQRRAGHEVTAEIGTITWEPWHLP